MVTLRRIARAFLRWTAVALTALVLLAGLLWTYAAHQPKALVTVDEVIPPDEADVTVRLVRAATESLDDEARGDRLYKRDAHAQPHGCVRATLDVEPGLDSRYRHGVFTEPGHRWRAWVRFSNGTQSDDTEPDARGMAIKLLDVPGPKLLTCPEDPEQSTQDFVMVNYHTFFLRNAGEYEQFFGYQKRNQPIRYFFAGWPFAWKLHPLYHGAHMLFQHVASPLATRYYTMSAYRFGPGNAKLSAQPCEMPDVAMPRSRPPHYLREALVKGLRDGPACFRLLVQLQDPSRNMPIEDPTIQWDETESPYVPVATLIIPAQEFGTDEQNRFCERLAFAPWHALPEHRPVGALNRIRFAVYREVSRRRHARNGVGRGAPDGWNLRFQAPACDASQSSLRVTPP
jgi:catalase